MIALCLVFIACLFWVLHDWYFGDATTKIFIKKYFIDWHYLKTILKVLLFFSVYFLPHKLIYMIGWWLITWVGFEFWCPIIPKEGKYKKTGNRIMDLFFIGNPLLGIILIIIILVVISLF